MRNSSCVKFEQFYSLHEAVLVVTEQKTTLVFSLYATIIGCYSATPQLPNITFTNKPCALSRRTKTHILNTALSRQINRFYLSEKLPTNVISFVIVVCDKLGDIVVSLS